MKKIIFLAMLLFSVCACAAFSADGSVSAVDLNPTWTEDYSGYIPNSSYLTSKDTVSVSAAWNSTKNAYVWTYVLSASGINSYNSAGIPSVPQFVANNIKSFTISFNGNVSEIVNPGSIVVVGASATENTSSITFDFSTVIVAAKPATITFESDYGWENMVQTTATANTSQFIPNETYSVFYTTSSLPTPSVPEPAGFVALLSGVVGLLGLKKFSK